MFKYRNSVINIRNVDFEGVFQKINKNNSLCIIVNKLEITEYEGVTKFALDDELNAAKVL